MTTPGNNPLPTVVSSSPIDLPEYAIQKVYTSMRLLRTDIGPCASVLASSLTAQGSDGYQSLRGSHGIFDGSFYFEVFWHPSPPSSQPLPQSLPSPNSPHNIHIIPSIDSLGYPFHSTLVPTESMVRSDLGLVPARITPSPNTLSGQNTSLSVGFSTISMELQTPVGYADLSFGYRALGGTKATNSIVETYGDAFQPGDVIGCFLHFPITSSTIDSASLTHQINRKLAPNGALTDQEEMQKELYDYQYSFTHIGPRPQSFIEFFKNGVSQGVAFTGLPVETFYPTVSLFNHAAVTVNFGPDFAFPPMEYSSEQDILAPLTQPQTLSASQIYHTLLTIDSNYRLLYTPFVMSAQEIYQEKMKEVGRSGTRNKTIVAALAPVFVPNPSLLVPTPPLSSALPKSRAPRSANGSLAPSGANSITMGASSGIVKQHGNTGRGRHPKNIPKPLSTTPTVASYLFLLGPLLQIPYWVRDGTVNPQFGAVIRLSVAESKLLVMRPRSHLKTSDYSRIYHFPSFTTTSFMIRYKDYFQWELEAVFRTIFERMETILASRVAGSVNLPLNLINSSFPHPKLHYVTRTRLHFFPNLVPNMRSHEVFDDLIMPVGNNTGFLKHLGETLRDHNVIFHLSKRYMHVPKIINQYQLYQEHLKLVPIHHPVVFEEGSDNDDDEESVLMVEDDEKSSTTTTSTTTPSDPKDPSTTDNTLKKASRKPSRPKGGPKASTEDDSDGDHPHSKPKRSFGTTPSNPSVSNYDGGLKRSKNLTKSQSIAEAKTFLLKEKRLVDALLSKSTSYHGPFEARFAPIMNMIDRDFITLSRGFERQAQMFYASLRQRKIAMFLSAKSTFIMSTNVEDIIIAEKQAALATVREWLMMQYQIHAKNGIPQQNSTMSPLTITPATETTTTTTIPGEPFTATTTMVANKRPKASKTPKQSVATITTTNQQSPQQEDQQITQSEDIDIPTPLRRAIIERSESWLAQLNSISEQLEERIVVYGKTLPQKPKTIKPKITAVVVGRSKQSKVATKRK